MLLWLGIAIGFVIVLAVMIRVARHADSIEDDSSYMREEHQFTPYGQKYLDIMLFRGGDD